jgi:hypothetical protein
MEREIHLFSRFEQQECGGTVYRVFGVNYDPSIKIGYRLEASGTGEWYGDANSRDFIAAGEAEITGLAGYFADWSPTRELQISSLLYTQARSYADRKANNENGALTTEGLTQLEAD